jgi:hypothetical protein
MRTIFLIPLFSLAVTAALATYQGWDTEATIIGGLALAGCLTLVAAGIANIIRERWAKEEEQREMELVRQAEQRAAAETRASPEQPKEPAAAPEPRKQRVSAVQPKKSRVKRASAVQPEKSSTSAPRPK